MVIIADDPSTGKTAITELYESKHQHLLSLGYFYISLRLTDEKRKMLKIMTESVYLSEENAMAAIKELCRKNQAVHRLKFEEQFVWCDSYGSVNNLRKFIDHDKSEISLIEDNLIK